MSLTQFDMLLNECGTYRIRGEFRINKAADDFIALHPKTDLEQVLAITKSPVDKVYEWSGHFVELEVNLVKGKQDQKHLIFNSFKEFTLHEETVKSPMKLIKKLKCD